MVRIDIKYVDCSDVRLLKKQNRQLSRAYIYEIFFLCPASKTENKREQGVEKKEPSQHKLFYAKNGSKKCPHFKSVQNDHFAK